MIAFGMGVALETNVEGCDVELGSDLGSDADLEAGADVEDTGTGRLEADLMER